MARGKILSVNPSKPEPMQGPNLLERKTWFLGKLECFKRGDCGQRSGAPLPQHL